MTPAKQYELGLAVLTAFLGPAENRVADINAIVAGKDSRDVVIGVLAVAGTITSTWALESGMTAQDIVQAVAEQWAEENPLT